jgi:hypothetical protein
MIQEPSRQAAILDFNDFEDPKSKTNFRCKAIGYATSYYSKA